MPNGLRNWDFKLIDKFLLEHYFKRVNVKGSHYYRSRINNENKLTFVQNHNNKSIPQKTLESAINQSGIPKEIWKKWGNGERKAHYDGAQQWQ